MFPEGFQRKYFKEEDVEGQPIVTRAGGFIYIPVFTESIEGKTKCLIVPIADHGEDITDAERLKQRRFADIRRFLYGSMEAQAEMQDNRTYQAHWLAVRKAVPNPAKNKLRTVFSRFEVLKAFKQVTGLYEQLVAAYQSNIEINLFWNSVNEIDIDDEYCISIRQQLGITDEMVDALVEIIDNGAE